MKLKSNRLKRNIKRVFIVLFTPFLLLGLVYLLFPEFIEEKAMDLMMPTVTINTNYKEKIVVETPEFYELMQIACSLTKTFQKNQNLLNKKTDYYNDVEAYFSNFNNHELILKLDKFLSSNPYGMSQQAIRLLSLNYKIKNDNSLVSNNMIQVSSALLTLFKSKAFLIPKNIELIEDFAKKTKFRVFYKKHQLYYEKLISNYNKLCDFQQMKNWLDTKFPNSQESFRIIFSPLTGGYHNTMRFKNHDKTKEQNFIFTSAPKKEIDTIQSEGNIEIESSKMTRIVFTEINHNYVNPLTDKFAKELELAMPNFKNWNYQKNGIYQSKYKTFNEYMTWGVFSLYALDTYNKKYVDSIIKIQADFINNKRGFRKFNAFNDKLKELYKQNRDAQMEDLYPLILEWMKRQH